MSYEGYEQHICEGGHKFTLDSYYAYDTSPCLCPHCGAKSVWYNAVDDTNCDAYGVIPEESWKPFLLTEEVVETCNFGHKHVTKHATWRVPTKEETELLRHYKDEETEQYVSLVISSVILE